MFLPKGLAIAAEGTHSRCRSEEMRPTDAWSSAVAERTHHRTGKLGLTITVWCLDFL